MVEPSLSGWEEYSEGTGTGDENADADGSIRIRDGSGDGPADEHPRARGGKADSADGAGSDPVGCILGLGLGPVEGSFGPRELGRKDGEPGEGNDEAGTGKDEHRGAGCDQRGADDQDREAFGVRSDPAQPFSGGSQAACHKEPFDGLMPIEGLSHSVEPGCRDHVMWSVLTATSCWDTPLRRLL